MIELKNIILNLDGKHILKNISAKINSGDFITIIGPNGAGKSSLLNLIAGKIKPSLGDLFLNNQNVIRQSEVERTKFLGRLFQDPKVNTVGSLSVRENIALAMLKNHRASILRQNRKLKPEILNLIKSVCGNSDEILDRPMNALSGGQRQMIALIMATIYPPDILLLDEPTAALDPVSAKKMLAFASDFISVHKITTLLITHDMACAQKMGNRLWIIDDGKIKKEFDEREKCKLTVTQLLEEIHALS